MVCIPLLHTPPSRTGSRPAVEEGTEAWRGGHLLQIPQSNEPPLHSCINTMSLVPGMSRADAPALGEQYHLTGQGANGQPGGYGSLLCGPDRHPSQCLPQAFA